MKLITRRPMNRADWAWLLAAVLFRLFFAGLAFLPEISNGAPRHVTKFNFDTGKWEDSVKPAYTTQLTIETSGNIQKMVQAAHTIDPDCRTIPSADNPKLTGSDYIQIFFGGVFGMVMLSLLFRIVLKICGKILGAKFSENEIASDLPPAASDRN